MSEKNVVSAGSPIHSANYWRSLQELANTDEYRAQVENEFPHGVDAQGDGWSRRRFLQVMSASIAMASLAGCRFPQEKIVPFAQRPEGVMPGTPMRFATTMELGPVASSVVATSYDGRPIKVDGNPAMGLSQGATSAFAQASVLDVYDPDRSQKILRRNGMGRSGGSWDDFLAFARGAGKGRMAVLAGASTSPAQNALLARLGQAGAGVFLWEPVCRVNEMKGAKLAFGTAALCQLDLSHARVLVDLDANLLQDHPTAIRNSKQFSAARRPDDGHMNRLYCWETTYSITGGMADHRFPTPATHMAAAVWALAAELVLGEGLPLPHGAGVDRAALARWKGHAAGGEHLSAVAKDLMAHRGESLLVAGLRLDPEVHALVHTLNEALGNVGHTVSYLPIQTPQIRFLPELVEALNKGQVETLVILGGNPVYTAPADLDFAAAMQKATHRVHLATHDDATSKLATWHIPQAHYLESWGDAMGWDMTHLSVQPLIAPLFGGKTATEVLSAFVDPTPRTSHEIARDSFHAMTGGQGAAPAVDADGGFEKRWRAFIHDGFRQDSGRAHGEPLALAGTPLTAPAEPPHLSADDLEIHFVHDQSVFDGRFADNAWLQEMPDFMTKLTWDNAALLGPATADELGVKHGDMVRLSYGGRELEMAVYVLPGQARHAVTVNLGYGRGDAGRVGQGAGFNAYALRTFAHLHQDHGLKLAKTGATYKLATTQDHHAIDQAGAQEIQKRVPGLVREGSLAEYKADEHFVDHLGIHSPPLESLWKEWEYNGHKWGMAIDLNLCNGCNACVIGCQAENNIAVVGKDEVSRGREMSWVRLDRYFMGDPDDPKVAQQPVACAQCEMAPCEQVCPVAATMHTREGLNAMVYNRCVGTRYCSNNCPYKVRRFNWFNNFEDLTETQRLVLNPDVTVRARGVMEKCTYCVQRIEGARVAARTEGRAMRDGDITPACQQTCPSDAIVFGDLNDPESRVSKLREHSRSYDLLNYLNLKPRTFYMARIRNPNPAITPVAMHDGGHGGGHGGGQETGQDAGHAGQGHG
ncbi:TAT-variant-translocated molybdopterin oxidoreductase [bacterium]|nr:TAT-variant-translocated molybdopterin oxidoreductase [bacterium]